MFTRKHWCLYFSTIFFGVSSSDWIPEANPMEMVNLLDDFPFGHGFILDLGFIYHQLMKNMGNNGKTMENQVVDGL